MLYSPRRLYRKLVELMKLDDPPWRIALGLSTGIFISCTPFYGFHTILAILFAFALRLNKAVTVTGAWLNLPWFAPFIYGLSLKVGELLLSGGQQHVLRELPWTELRAAFWPPRAWPGLLEELATYSTLLIWASKALLVGTTIVGLLAAAVTYVVALAVIREMRRLHGSPAEET